MPSNKSYLEKRQKYKYKGKDGKTYHMILCSYCDQYIKIAHGQKKHVDTCPHCGVTSKHLLKPKTERLLFELQDKYLQSIDQELFELYSKEIKKPTEEQNERIIKKHHANMDQDTLLELYMLVTQYVSSLLKKFMKTKGFYLPREEFINKVEFAAFLWFEQFTKQPFKIESSWAGQLQWKIKESLYKYSKEEQIDSIDTSIKDKENFEKTDLLGIQEKLHIEQVFIKSDDDLYNQKESIVEEVIKIFKLTLEAEENIGDRQDRKEFYISLIAFIYFLQGKTKKINHIINFFGNNIKDNLEKLKLLLYNALKDSESTR